MTPGVATGGGVSGLADVLSQATAVTILCHIRPDADTIGSGLALAIALDRRGVDVEVSYPGGDPLPAALADLPGSKFLVEPAQLHGHPVAVAVDCASPGRLDELAAVFERAEHRLVVDHHASNPGFGTVAVVEPDADCTAELILEILDVADVDVDADVATCLYAGLVTDTGSFRWCRPRSHLIAARLLDLGVDGQLWSRRLLDTHSSGWLSMVSAALGSATVLPDAFGGEGLVYAHVTLEQAAGLSWEEAESIIDLIRTVDQAEVAAVFKETAPQVWSVSLRSTSIDLVPLARRLGGGGHPHAAGYSDTGSADDILADLVQLV
ncbi:DHH family phosphoesterase [Williamsia sterculiae]|uniref:Phosphoesterase RecJ domain-containing protein n=1 Tax=Williamsia sterculiae TaxID=1344003 RepID=A0A1N7EC72_9NOCA|nr:DHH family phosphoesterase [Williamsia sterculiae]SIR85664.1 phosphoesterase RecJ domain-containing protein [Williamsia sterculiae]